MLSATTTGSELHVAGDYRAEAIDGCGHFLHLERPADVNARILEFLA